MFPALSSIWGVDKIPSYKSVKEAWGPFLEGSEKFSHPKSRSKISNLGLMTSELLYAHILNTNRGSLHTISFSGIHPSLFEYRLTKKGFSGPKRYRGFRETGPRIERISDFHVKSSMDQCSNWTSSFSKTKNDQSFWSFSFIRCKTL